MPPDFLLFRDALHQLSLEPDEQRSKLRNVDIPFELADDLGHAVLSLDHAQEAAGVVLDQDLVRALLELDALFDRNDPEDWFWSPEALDVHPVWAEARRRARELLVRVPGW